MIGNVLETLLMKLSNGETIHPSEIQQLKTVLNTLTNVAGWVDGPDRLKVGAVDVGYSVRLSVDGLKVYRPGNTGEYPLVQTGKLDADGDLSLGSDISAAATAGFNVFTNDQTYNSESVGAGDVMLGDNSSGKPNLFWDKSAGTLYFRVGTINMNNISSGALQMPGVRSSKGIPQSISDATTTIVTLASTNYDDMDFAVPRENAFTIPTGFGGWFDIKIYWEYAANATGYRIMKARKNGSTDLFGQRLPATVTSIVQSTTSLEVALSPEDYVEFITYQNSGGSLLLNEFTVTMGKMR